MRSSLHVRQMIWISPCLLGLFGILGILGCGGKDEPPPPPPPPEITIAVYAGGKKGGISGPLYYWKDKWEKDTGAKLNIVEIPYAQIYERIMADVRQGGGEFDGVVTAAFMYGDYIENDYIIPIDAYFDKPGFPKWTKESVVAPIAKLHQWDGVWYGCPNDADAHILYFRKDVLGNPKYQEAFEEKKGRKMKVPPRTWDEVAEIAEFFADGIDWNENGEQDEYGMTMHLKGGGQGYWHYMSLSAPYVVNPAPKVTRYHNVYAFDPETMEPWIDSPGHVRALEMLRRLAKTGDPAQTSWGLNQAWDRFLTGHAIFCFSWGDLGRLAQDPEKSKVQGKLGCCALPGTMEVYSQRDKKWKELNRPNMIANTCGGTWHGVICKKSKHPELVYNLFAFQANAATNMFNIGQGWSGIDPGRTFQFLPPNGKAKLSDYTDYGFNVNDVKEYTEAYWANYSQTGGVLEYLRIPGTSRFHDALDDELSRAMNDPAIPAEEIMKSVAAKWQRIIADLNTELGSGKLLELYQQSIGYKPKGSEQ